MRRVIVLRNFIEHVPGVGMVVGNAARPATEKRKAREADIVSLTAEKAQKRVDSGHARYADPHGENDGDIPARRKTSRERRLAARAERRAAKAAGNDAIEVAPDGEQEGELTGDGTGEALPELTEENAAEVKTAGGKASRRKAKADTDAPVD